MLVSDLESCFHRRQPISHGSCGGLVGLIVAHYIVVIPSVLKKIKGTHKDGRKVGKPPHYIQKARVGMGLGYF